MVLVMLVLHCNPIMKIKSTLASTQGNKMKSFKLTGIISILLTVLAVSPAAYAASLPALGTSDSFSVLSSSFINTATGTTLNGDLGYTTPPAVTPAVTGTTHVADAVYNQAGIDQATALANLNSQTCTFNFASGAVDLASDTTHGAIGVYTPGVYCVSGAASVGGGGTITLSGAGVFIFRSTGAFTTTANSIVTATGGASACNALWAPGAAATLGANSTFIGTIIDPSGITIGSTVTWTGRALAFGGTVSTTSDTINTVPACAAASNTGASTAANNAAAKTPGLPNTGGAAQAGHFPLWGIPAALLSVVSAAYIIRRHA
jgi:hypothetical protein